MGSGIVARGSFVEFMAPALFEEAEFDHLVAHDVGVRSESGAHGPERIVHHIVPILLVERHHIKWQSVAACYERAHLDVFLGRAVALAVVKPDSYIEKVQVMAFLHKPVDGHGAVNAS